MTVLGIVGSPSVRVVLNSLGLELLSGLVPDEIVVFVEDGELGEFVVDQVSRVVSVFEDRVPVRYVVLGRDFSRWFSLGVDVDLIDITPGRKIHVLGLYAYASERGIPVRYAYVLDERRFGYRYFGYAPPYAIRLLEVVRGHVYPLELKIPEPLVRVVGEEFSVDPRVIHAYVNVLRSQATRVVINTCGSRAVLNVKYEPVVEEVEETYSGWRKRACSISDLEWCLDRGKPVRISVEALRECASRGCSIVVDTNVLVLGLLDEITTYTPKNLLEIPPPVMSELTTFLEAKGRALELHVPKMLGLVEMWRHGLTGMISHERGDQAIARYAQKLKSERKCVCMATGDRNLALLVKSMGIDTILVEQDQETSKLEETRLPETIECLTLHKGTRITIPGVEEIEIRDHKLLEGKGVNVKVHVGNKRLFQVVKTLVENTL